MTIGTYNNWGKDCGIIVLSFEIRPVYWSTQIKNGTKEIQVILAFFNFGIYFDIRRKENPNPSLWQRITDWPFDW